MTRSGKLFSSMALPLIAAAALLSLAACSSNKSVDVQKAAFWPTQPDEPRLQFLVSFSQSSDIAPRKSALDDLIYGKEPQKVLPIKKPYGVAMWNGRIYVCDLRGAAVLVLDLRNHQTLVMGQTGSDTLLSPSGIAISPDGMKYVADIGRGMVYVFDAQDKLFGKIGHKDMKPTGIAVHQDELYVSDQKAQQIEIYNRNTGKLLRKLGEPGMADGQFIWPLGIAVDDKGQIYVADVLKCQIQKFDHQGSHLATISGASRSVGGLVRPKHIAVDHDGTVFVVDSAFQNVQLFDPIGRVYTFFGGGGDFPGAMQMPVGICLHDGDLDLFQKYVHPAFQAEKLVVVSNQFGDKKVSVYAYGRLRPGKTLADISASQGLVKLGLGDNTPGALAIDPNAAEDSDATAQPTTQPTTQPSR